MVEFPACSDDGEVDVSALFFDGRPLSPDYLDAYRKYRKYPTRHAPPVADEYPLVMIDIDRRTQGLTIWHAVAPSTPRPARFASISGERIPC